MFATVECRDAPGGLKGFLRDVFTMPEISFQRVSVPFGESFYRVLVTEYRGQIPVKETVEKLKKLRGSVIFEVNFPCDESTAEIEFVPEKFICHLLFNSAVDYITKLKIDPVKSSVTVFDPKGYYTKKLDALVPLFSKIRVYTKEVSAYEKVSALLMEKFGVSVPVCGKFTGKAPDSTVVICPGQIPFCDFFKGIIFTDAEDTPPCGCCIRGYGVDLPGEYELLRPSGISKMHFAAALYEKGGVESLGELSFSKLRLT